MLLPDGKKKRAMHELSRRIKCMHTHWICFVRKRSLLALIITTCNYAARERLSFIGKITEIKSAETCANLA